MDDNRGQPPSENTSAVTRKEFDLLAGKVDSMHINLKRVHLLLDQIATAVKVPVPQPQPIIEDLNLLQEDNKEDELRVLLEEPENTVSEALLPQPLLHGTRAGSESSTVIEATPPTTVYTELTGIPLLPLAVVKLEANIQLSVEPVPKKIVSPHVSQDSEDRWSCCDMVCETDPLSSSSLEEDLFASTECSRSRPEKHKLPIASRVLRKRQHRSRQPLCGRSSSSSREDQRHRQNRLLHGKQHSPILQLKRVDSQPSSTAQLACSAKSIERSRSPPSILENEEWLQIMTNYEADTEDAATSSCTSIKPTMESYSTHESLQLSDSDVPPGVKFWDAYLRELDRKYDKFDLTFEWYQVSQLECKGISRLLVLDAMQKFRDRYNQREPNAMAQLYAFLPRNFKSAPRSLYEDQRFRYKDIPDSIFDPETTEHPKAVFWSQNSASLSSPTICRARQRLMDTVPSAPPAVSNAPTCLYKMPAERLRAWNGRFSTSGGSRHSSSAPAAARFSSRRSRSASPRLSESAPRSS